MSARLPLGLGLLWVAAMAAFPGPNASVADEYGRVEVVRDRWGTAHVFAETDAGAMYGLGYATAEDRGFQMHYHLRIVQGRLAELLGDVPKVRRRETALQNDRKMRTFGFHRAAKQVVENLDPESSALLAAFSDGVNRFFRDNAGKLHEMYAKVGLEPEPWTPADCILSWWHFGQFFATDGTRDLLAWRNRTEGGPPGRQLFTPPPDLDRLPPDESTAVIQRGDVTDAWLQRGRAFMISHGFDLDGAAGGDATPGPKFSHAWVADGKVTGTGSAVLVSEPRTPVANPSLLYEFHISGKTFNARGVGVAGSPIILIGFNAHVAWGMTALGADQADLFRLQTDDEHPNQYRFDGRWREMESIEEEIRVKGGRPQTLVVRHTHLGPVATEFAFARRGDSPVVLKRIPLCEPDRETIQGAMAMLRARDVHAFDRALPDWRFPSANVVFGDRQGNIGFSLVGALPLRSPLALDAGGTAHDGSAAKYDWRGIIPHDLMPRLIDPDRGVLFSANHRPIGSFYPLALGISTGSMGDTLRSWRLRELLRDRAHLMPAGLLEIHGDTVNPARREIVRLGLHLRDALKRELSPEARWALEYLEPWYRQGARSDLNVPGAALALEMNTFFRFVNTDLAFVYGGGESGLSYFLKTAGRRLDDDPKAELTPREQAYVDTTLANAWTAASRLYGPDPKKWDAEARRLLRGRRLGYFEGLDGFASLDPGGDLEMPALACPDRGTILSQTGQSYSQWVRLDDVDRALSLLPPGPSERPGSPMRTANCRAWAAGELHRAPLSRAAVERIAADRKVLLP